MKKLLSLPPNLVKYFFDVTNYSKDEWFCTYDPIDHRLGSGGGSTWLLEQAFSTAATETDFNDWLSQEQRVLLHAGGMGRRLPAYSPQGKILTPIPVFRWERGQRLSQDLLSLQIPFCEQVMKAAPSSMHTLIVSGDVYIRSTTPITNLPEADVVCLGLWLDSDIAKNHGVFVSSRENPSALKCMLQKPSTQTLSELQKDHFYLTDIGVWLLSDRAVKVLMQKSKTDGKIGKYDLYSEFGCALGTSPTIADAEINALSVAIVPLMGGEFYHFGTSHELITSSLALQNLVNDQREIMHRSQKPHPSIFVQNAETWIKFQEQNQHVWIENSCISEKWQIADHHVITGVPENAWEICLTAGQCVDIVPIGENAYVVRPYGFNDVFKGALDDLDTQFIGQPFMAWADRRKIDIAAIEGKEDLQNAKIFPVVNSVNDAGLVLRWMLNEPNQQGGKLIWKTAQKMSANDIGNEANLLRLCEQRQQNRAKNWPFLAKNHVHSVFYQVDLEDAAREFASNNIAAPSPLAENEPLLKRAQDAMFRSELATLKNIPDEDDNDGKAFAFLRDGLTQSARETKQQPRMSVHGDQIVWGRCPVRIDIAGGWTDTPPYCLMEGGNVINLAIELNGQPPLQTYVRPSNDYQIVLRSIDLGAAEHVTTYEQLADFTKVGSPFSIPKAALALAGFHPDFSQQRYPDLATQLRDFGCGIELTTLSAIPAGSGLGTSSILASTVLGALNDFCGLMWDKNEIGLRTLVLEQLLTTGGGWQDQFGGILQGIKLLQTDKGFNQSPVVRWLPDTLFTQPDYHACHLLYYTGITRTAKHLLAQIVRRMFLNQHEELQLLRQMKEHTLEMFETIQREDFKQMGLLMRKTWKQNQLLDNGTNPEAVQKLTALIDDYCLGYKLPGAGGGGYLYMIAKDPEAAAKIRQILSNNPLNGNARFVEMSLSQNGLQVSRS